MIKNAIYKKQEYLFSMQRLSNTSRMLNIQIDFTPINKNGLLFESIVPVFNHDNNYFTPCFVINADKSFLQGSIIFQKLKFQDRVKNSYQKNLPNPLSLAEPSSNYCQVCQLHYENYFNHINNPEHQTANRKTKANQLIFQLCEQYSIIKKKNKNIKKQTKKMFIQLQKQSERILRSCRQKNKIQQQGKNFSYVSTKINFSHMQAA